MEADVIIIGYGPTGVVAANTLASRGRTVVALERDEKIYPRARAVTVNDWTMRIFQDLDLDREALKVLDPQRALRWIQYDGIELLRIEFPPSTLGTQGGTRFYNMYQPAMEPVLRAGAQRYGDAVTVRYGQEVTDIVQHADRVEVRYRDVQTGAEHTVRGCYVIAADGGSSTVRKSLGIELLGDTEQVQWIVIDCKVKRWWPDRDYLTFWSDRRRPVVDIPLPLGNHRWELPLEPGESPDDFATEEQVWPLLESMGVTHEDVDIHQFAFYHHHVRMAERWRHGRVFLAGDAAHLMPPWAGAGMQSGMRDAYDLGWKLARVLDGSSPQDLLETYEAERRPNVEHFTQLAVGLGQIIKQQAPAPPPTDEEPPLIAAPFLDIGDPASIAGKMAPQPMVSTSDGWMHRLDRALGRGYVLLGDGVDPRTVLTDDQLAAWTALGADFITVRERGVGTKAPTDLVDLSGDLVAWMRRFGAQSVALRPDRFATTL